MKLQHLRGLDQDLKRGLKYNRRHGGVSDVLRRTMRRPSKSGWRMNAISSIDNGMGKCDNCGNDAEFRSIVNGEIEYQLCRNCFAKRNKKKK